MIAVIHQSKISENFDGIGLNFVDSRQKLMIDYLITMQLSTNNHLVK